MAGAGQFECSGNLAWVNEAWSPMAGIPLNKTCILKMSNHVFAKPASLPMNLLVPVPIKDFNVLGHNGSLKYAIPVEILHAFWWALGRALDTGAPDAVMDA